LNLNKNINRSINASIRERERETMDNYNSFEIKMLLNKNMVLKLDKLSLIYIDNLYVITPLGNIPVFSIKNNTNKELDLLFEFIRWLKKEKKKYCRNK